MSNPVPRVEKIESENVSGYYRNLGSLRDGNETWRKRFGNSFPS